MTEKEFALLALAMSAARPFDTEESAYDHAHTSTLLVVNLVREAKRLGWLERDPDRKDAPE